MFADVALEGGGVRAAELEEVMRGVDYRRFQDGPRWRGLLVGKAVAVLLEQGIYDGQFLKDWLGERLGSGPGVTGGHGDAFGHCDASRSAWRRMGS